MSRTFHNSANCERVDFGVIPNEARNLSLFKTQGQRDSSASGAPRFTENILGERDGDFPGFLEATGEGIAK
jgi:hypothetical protein